MIQLIPFCPNLQHPQYLDILEILKLRKVPVKLLDDLPAIAYIACEDATPIALGSLRKIEGNLAMLDSFITDPEKSSEIRHEALKQLTSILLEEAKKCGIQKIIALTEEESLMLRGYHEGFGYVPVKVMVCHLGEKI